MAPTTGAGLEAVFDKGLIVNKNKLEKLILSLGTFEKMSFVLKALSTENVFDEDLIHADVKPHVKRANMRHLNIPTGTIDISPDAESQDLVDEFIFNVKKSKPILPAPVAIYKFQNSSWCTFGNGTPACMFEAKKRLALEGINWKIPVRVVASTLCQTNGARLYRNNMISYGKVYRVIEPDVVTALKKLGVQSISRAVFERAAGE